MKCLLQRCSDRRLKLTNELLQGIKLLKMYAWEELYSKAIEVVRKEEVLNLLYINLCMIAARKILRIKCFNRCWAGQNQNLNLRLPDVNGPRPTYLATVVCGTR